MGIWSQLSRRRRIQLGLLLLMMLASGCAELLSLGAVLPFLAVLNDPDRLWQQPLVHALATWLGFKAASQLLLPATLVFAAAAVLAGLFRLVNLWLNGRLAAAVGSDLSCEAYRRTLYQPYAVHLQRNSSTVIAGVTSQIAATVGALNAFLQLLSSAVVSFGLLIGLLLIDSTIALAAVTLFGTAYLTLSITTRRELRSNGQKIVFVSSQHIKALQEGLGAIRDVLLDGNQATYLQIYRQADRPFRQLLAKNVFLATFPRYLFEALGMVAIAFLACLLMLQRGSGAAVIPLLGALALGAQRLLPCLQQIYSGWATLKGYNAAMKDVLEMLSQPVPALVKEVKPLRLCQCLQLQNLHFSYGPELPEVLRGIDIKIYRGERIGLIGSTGSGKSTTLDLLMGLLKPTDGTFLVDGVNLHDAKHPERLNAWRATIAHVPQNIYLADSSFVENIAFGVPFLDINLNRVKRAAEQAQLSKFIEESPKGYESFVGERGIQLSGGQRQRIGIARALYKQAEVLVLDEATSALDSSTEAAVMAAVEQLNKELTIVIIAHRLSTIENCDRVIRLEHGSILKEGPPAEVLGS